MTVWEVRGILCKVICFTPPLGRRERVFAMFEKNLELGYLLDFYGELLSDHRREAMNYYYNDDMSLAEIAEVLGITRQGVRDLIKKAGDELTFYEEKLGLARRFREVEAYADEARALIGKGEDERLAAIEKIIGTVS